VVVIEDKTIMRAPIDRCFDLARSVEVHLAGNVNCGETAAAISGATSGLLGMSQRVTWRARHFGVRLALTSEITAFDPPRFFEDTMIYGPFRSMRHGHFFRSLTSGETEMRDIFRFEAPLPILGPLVEAAILRRYMRKLLGERNRVIKQIAESEEWRRYLPCGS
jgi:ligand-binding SRPBCC domain-containing protein